MKCGKTNCSLEAVAGMKLRIPEMGGDKAVEVVLGLPLCAEHLKSAKGADFLTADPRNDLRRIVTMQCRWLQIALPDYERAEVLPISFDSKEWRALKQAPPTVDPGRQGL